MPPLLPACRTAWNSILSVIVMFDTHVQAIDLLPPGFQFPKWQPFRIHLSCYRAEGRFLHQWVHKSSMYRVQMARLMSCSLRRKCHGRSLEICSENHSNSNMNRVRFARNREQLILIGTPISCRYILIRVRVRIRIRSVAPVWPSIRVSSITQNRTTYTR